MSRVIAAFLLIVVLFVGGSAIAATAYQAGVTAAIAQVPADGSSVVTPVIWSGYGWNPGIGFGFLGFLGTILFLFIVFGLFRAIVSGGRHRHGWGPGGAGGAGGPDGQSPWRDRAHGTFQAWHDEAHATGTSHGTPPPLAG